MRICHICAIDFGTDNFAAVVCSDGSSGLYKGGAVLSECQWFHKERARATGIITKGHEHIMRRFRMDAKFLTDVVEAFANRVCSYAASIFHHKILARRCISDRTKKNP